MEKLSTRFTKFLVILIMILTFSSSLIAQKVELSFKDTPIRTVLNEVSRQTGYNFVFSNALAEVDKRIDILFKGEISDSISEVLDMIFENTGIIYSISDNQIALRNRAIERGTAISEVNSSTSTAQEQEKQVRGVVLDTDTNEPLIGVIIRVKETNAVTQTDIDGKYTITAPHDATLIFSFIGMRTQEILINNRALIEVALEPDLTILDEVMVVAYGTAKKSTFTGSAAVVDEEILNLRPITEVSQALVGTTPGLQVGTSSGAPGSEPTLRIRGIGSFSGSNSPLIVLDGMPYDNAISSINPNDIESITVLKDASSAALYGSRAANGVLLINTKKGKIGKPKVVAKYNLGFTTSQSSEYSVLDDKGYMELYWETYRNGYIYNGLSEADANALAGPALLTALAYNPFLMNATELFDNQGRFNPNAINHWADDIDWYGAITQLGKRHDATLSISGATEKTNYYTSVGYMKEEGYWTGSEFERISANASSNSQITPWLKVGMNLNLGHSTREGDQNTSSGNNNNPFRATKYIGNLFPIHIHDPATGAYVYDDFGNKIYDFGNGWESPDGSIVVPPRDGFANTNHVLENRNIYNGFYRQTINTKGYLEATFTKGLKFTVNAGLGSNMYRSWDGSLIYEQKGNAGSSSKNTSNTSTWTFQQLLNYQLDKGKHHFDALVGHESYQYSYHYMSTSMKTQTIPGDNFEYRNFTEINALPSSYTNNYRVEGYLSRINYDYDEKYFVSASYRRDGSSRFYKDVRWGNFWSVGAGWTIDKEKFMENIKFINQLKLRVSYGIVGNDDISGYYPWRATYEVNNNGEPGYVQSTLGNRELTWETSKNFDIATEFLLFKGRLDGSIEYFHRESSDLLFSVPQALSAGVGSIDVNAGTMYNKGLELMFDGLVLKTNNLSLSLNGNATFIQNKITKLPLDPYVTSVYKIQEGYSRYDFWLRQWYKVNPETGYNLFVPDLENYTFNEGELLEIDGAQYTETVEKSLYDYSGEAIPKVTGGFGTNLSWRNFNLKLDFYYQLGGLFYDNGYRNLMVGSSVYYKQHSDLVNRWQKPGDVTNIARVSNAGDGTNIGAGSSTRWLVSSNMLELTNINLSYSVPKKILQPYNISELIIYFSANNALLFAARTGLYPRRNFSSGYIANVDVYNPARVFSFGLSLTF